MKKYDKLVRDLIPEIIIKDGKEYSVKIASKEEKLHLLEEKLKEEVNEYLEDKNIEELADVMDSPRHLVILRMILLRLERRREMSVVALRMELF